MNEALMQELAGRVLDVIGAEFEHAPPSEVIMALFGVLLGLGRVSGESDFRLHQGFGSFLEDNAD